MKRFTAVLLTIVMALSAMCVPFSASAERDVSAEEALATELKSLGLFKGVSDTDFALGRAPSRVEAIVMLIRVLGKESETTAKSWNHPFTDVPTWADGYVGYAYESGLTKGSSATQFGTGSATGAMYVTFVLRALGYSDADGKDFTWNDPFTLAEEIGILPESVDRDAFLRADVATVSHAALSAKLKDSDKTLAEKLMEAGVFTEEDYGKYCTHKPEKPAEEPLKEMSAEEIYANCAPAVFYIEVSDKDGNVTSTGSGFFIDDKGTAVTNYHVIDDAHSATAQFSDGDKKYDILGVYDCSSDEDWAVVKVDCEENPYLKVGEESTVVGASTVYAIGSPKGLQNTITTGIISNPSREDGGIKYIQTSAAISAGSSGGALINKYGQVIGITSGSYLGGQNLNVALPMTYVGDYRSASLIDLATFSTAEIEYTIDPKKIEVYEGGEAYITLNFTCTGFPEDFKDYDIMVGCEDTEIATIEFTDEDENARPINIKLTGLSKGTTMLVVSNNRNYQTKSVRVDVRAKDFVSYTRETAREYLTNWLKENCEEKDGVYSVGYTIRDTDTAQVWYTSIYYKPEKNELVVGGIRFLSGGETFMVSLDIPLNSDVKFTCSVSKGNDLVRGGYGVIDRASFRADTTVKFDYYTGENSERRNFSEQSTEGIHQMIKLFGYCLDNNVGEISIEDFGFTVYED